MTKVTTIKSAVCRNGRFGEHHISVEQREKEDSSLEYVYRNGHSDPLVCSYEQANYFFEVRLKEAAFDLLKGIMNARDDLHRGIRIQAAERFFASIKE